MKKKKLTLGTVLIYAVLGIASFLFLFPFVIMISTSFKPFEEVSELPIRIFPRNWTLESYREVFATFPFFRYLGNTLMLVVHNVVGTVFSSSLVAYGLSRIRWKGRELLFGITLSVMMIPGAVTMVPTYLVFSKLHVVGTYIPLILPSFFGNAFNIFLLRQFFMGLPRSLEDAARIDGCNELQIYGRVFLPLMKPALITIAVFQISGTWNDYTGPLLYLSTEDKYTLQYGLHRFTSTYNTVVTCQIAAALMISLPMVLLFFLAQKQFTQGITFSGIKG